MILRAWAPAALIAATLFTSFERASEACSPPYPGLSSTIPKDGETYPANAAIFLQGYDITLDAVTVTIDGMPASLVSAAAIEPLWLAARTVLVSPAPAAGQTVEIAGDFCPAGSMCEPQAFSFVAGEPDMTAPPAPSGLVFDVHDYPDFKSSGGDCQSDSDLAWWITATGEPSSPTESRVIVTFEGFRDPDFKDLAFATSTFLDSADTTVVIRKTIDFLNGAAAPEALCIRATTIDASGNKDAVFTSTCEPCNYRKDSAPPMSDWPPGEPEWTAADAYPGGPCSMGSGSSGSGSSGGAGGNTGNGDTVIVDGCACRLQGGHSGLAPASSAALAVIALLGVARRRRRSKTLDCS